MIRRSPTRIELKLDDLNDFDYIQKFEKKKNPSGNVLGATDAQKLMRQERIGLGFRPIRSSSNVGVNQSGSFTAGVGGLSSGSGAVSGGAGVNSVSDIGPPVTPTNNDNTPLDMNVTNGSVVGAEGVSQSSTMEDSNRQLTTNTSNMSLDESL